MRPEILENTLIGIDKLLVIQQCIENIQRQDIPGDTAELGVYRGGVSLFIADALPDRVHFAFDSFAGLTNAEDGVDLHKNGDFSDVVLADTLKLLDRPNIVVARGHFPDTAPTIPTRYCLVHIDADTYQSTRDALEYFYPRLSPGGFLVLDDYQWVHCPGVERAVTEFFADKSVAKQVLVNGQLVVTTAPTDTKFLRVWFDHGLGDCVHFIQVLQLYRDRNYLVSVHFEHNKSAIWHAAGIPRCELDGTPRHEFVYDGFFNQPNVKEDWSGSKTAFNMTYPPMPPLGPTGLLWEELVTVDQTDAVAQYIADHPATQQMQRALADLPRPIVLLHTNGSNWAAMKNIPPDVARELYDRLLEHTAASIVLLDWDWRVPPPRNNCRVRHVARDFGHLSTAHLLALMQEASLIIGIDSGPLHAAILTNTPALGVFHNFYPSCVTLPRARSAFMTRNADTYRPINQARRKRWSILEYGGDVPTAEDIARHAIRMLDGPRYLRPERIGRDVMLQQLVRDWLRATPPGCPDADRQRTFDWMLRETSARFGNDGPTIVETGCQRSDEDWSAGSSTYLFGCYLEGLGRGKLHSVDISESNVATARACTQPWQDYIEHHVSDSVTWLQNNEVPIDLLYLDSLDADHPETASHGLKEFQAALPSLHARSIVVIDDTSWSGSDFSAPEANSGRYRGKGAAIVPFALANGWRVAASGYQICLVRT